MPKHIHSTASKENQKQRIDHLFLNDMRHVSSMPTNSFQTVKYKFRLIYENFTNAIKEIGSMNPRALWESQYGSPAQTRDEISALKLVFYVTETYVDCLNRLKKDMKSFAPLTDNFAPNEISKDMRVDSKFRHGR